MKIFGGLLPFIGFRNEPVDEDMKRFFNFDDDTTEVETFQMEWFGCGIVICLAPVTDE